MQEVCRPPAIAKDRLMKMEEGLQRSPKSLTQRMRSAQNVKGDQIQKGFSQDKKCLMDSWISLKATLNPQCSHRWGGYEPQLLPSRKLPMDIRRRNTLQGRASLNFWKKTFYLLTKIRLQKVLTNQLANKIGRLPKTTLLAKKKVGGELC